MFISYSSSKVLQVNIGRSLYEVIPCKLGFRRNIRKKGNEKNGLVVLVQLEDNVLACINGTLDFSDCIGNKNK